MLRLPTAALKALSAKRTTATTSHNRPAALLPATHVSNPLASIGKLFAVSRRWISAKAARDDDINPLTYNYHDEVKQVVEEDKDSDRTLLDPRQVIEPQLVPKSEDPRFQRTWERFHDRYQKRRSMMALSMDEEEKAEEMSRYIPPWVDMLGLGAVQPIEDPDLDELYTSYDPDLQETWEDEYYRKVMTEDLDLDNPGGDWGETRMSYGLSPPVKIYFRAMIDAFEMEEYDRILQLFDALRTDMEISHHEIPAGIYRLAMDAYARENPGEAEKCFRKIAEINALRPDDYDTLIEAFVISGDNLRALDVYTALLSGHLRKEASVEAHQLGFIAATLPGDSIVVEKSRKMLVGMEGGGADAVPREAEVATYAMHQALQANNVDAIYKQYARVKETYSDVPEARRKDVLRDSGAIILREMNKRQEYLPALEVFRFMCSELGDNWIFASSLITEYVLRAYINTGDIEEAKRLLQKYMETQDSEETPRDPVVIELLNPFVEFAIRKGSQDDIDKVFELAIELGFPEETHSPLYLAAMRATDDPSTIAAFFDEVDLEESDPDAPVCIALNCFIKQNMWKEAAQTWKTAIQVATFQTVEPYIAGLQVVDHFKDLDGIMTIARAIAANGTPITYGFARDLATALSKALPLRDEKNDRITHELLKRIRSHQKHPHLMMSRVHQIGALHVMEKVRAGVQELFVD